MIGFKKGGDVKYSHRFLIDGREVGFYGNVNGSTDVKFNRVAMIASRYTEIVNKLRNIINSSKSIPTSIRYNCAVATLIILKTGIRIGNEDSAEGFYSEYKEKGKRVLAKTYGLTTMERNHIKISPNGIVSFDFIGKKHVDNHFVLDKELSQYVISIYQSGYDPVFNIDDYTLTKFIKDETSPYFSSKDFRTFRANVYGYRYLMSLPTPTDKKTYKESVKYVCTMVSKKLNNTPQVVKTSYIDPDLFVYNWGSEDQWDKEKKEYGGLIYGRHQV
jgi:DNA topoisomerase IB